MALQQAAIEARLEQSSGAFETLEEFGSYVSRRANALTMTSPRPMKVENPEQELVHLLHRLVGPRKEAAPRAGRVTVELESVLRQQGVVSGLRRNVSVHPPSLPNAIRAPFAYRNGRMNLIEPVQFEGQTPARIFNKASVLAVEGEFLADYKDPALGDVGLVVVAKFAPEQEAERETTASVFKRHGVPMYSFGALEPLIADIRQHTH